MFKLPVGPMNLGVVSIMRDKGLRDPAINRCISRKLRRNNGMEVMTLVDCASGVCLQLCLPGLSFCVYIGVILCLWDALLSCTGFTWFQLVYHFTIVLMMIVMSTDGRGIPMTTLSRLEGSRCERSEWPLVQSKGAGLIAPSMRVLGHTVVSSRSDWVTTLHHFRTLWGCSAFAEGVG